jgi:hypothetical protein
MEYPFLPYFTWLALAGLVVLIVMAVKKKSFAIRIVAFLAFYHIQSLILFDGVSADFMMTDQQRFVLVVLPTLAFLGAFFLLFLGRLICRGVLFQSLRQGIPLTGLVILVWAGTLVHADDFKQNIMYRDNALTVEDAYLRQWAKQYAGEGALFYYDVSPVLSAVGWSSFLPMSLFDLDSADFEKLSQTRQGQIFLIQGKYCSPNFASISKMLVRNNYYYCNQINSYFLQDTLLDTAIGSDRLAIRRITGLSKKDPNRRLRIMDLHENTDALYLILKLYDTLPHPWKLERYLNDSLVASTPYFSGDHADPYLWERFKPDTNRIDYRIIDTIADTVVHTDYLKLLRKKPGG